jgi:hypothetical protein
VDDESVLVDIDHGVVSSTNSAESPCSSSRDQSEGEFDTRRPRAAKSMALTSISRSSESTASLLPSSESSGTVSQASSTGFEPPWSW